MSGRYPLLTTPAVVLLFLAACGGAGGQPQASPTVTPEPTLAVSCTAIENIASYRYTLGLKLDMPGLPASQTAPQDDAFDPFADILLGLLRDIQIEGAFVAPDRSQAILRFQEEEVEVRTIGNQSWVRLGDVWREETPPAQEVFLSPRTICDQIVPDLGDALAGIPSSPETINGVATRHYHLEEANLPQLSQRLGTEANAELPEAFQVDAWLAEEGGWPVRLHLASRARDEEGRPVSLELFLEFRDTNSPDIEIEPPQVTGGQA
jgi:hypothetical protein